MTTGYQDNKHVRRINKPEGLRTEPERKKMAIFYDEASAGKFVCLVKR